MAEVDWTDDEAYAYLAHLDPSALAWELLRRNAGYRAAFAANQPIEAYGLRFALDPSGDAREADPIWRWTYAPAVVVQMAASPASGITTRQLLERSAHSRSAPDGLHLRFPCGLQAHLSPSISGRQPLAALLPFNGDFLRRLAAARALNAGLFGRWSAPGKLSKPARLRLARAIRAHDGRQQGATHRDLAEKIFRQTFEQSLDWRTSPTRALVMRLSAGGRRLVNGDYVRLLR
jgi:hypothetical protein